MKKRYLILLFPIFLIIMFILSCDSAEVKIYKQLQEIDLDIANANTSLENTISSLQQSFEELVELGITFTDDQNIDENFNQFNLALKSSNELSQRLTHLFELDSLAHLTEMNQQAPDTLKEILEQENSRIQALKSLLNSLNQLNKELTTMDTVFYNNKNNEVFSYITIVREYFNQIQADYSQYSDAVTEYMQQKSNLYSQLNS
ncbi:MAG: hypothetical protein K2G70_04990 [Turicibacter sp.]|nr:hypothetical protein [Turicibacter sp.]